jgi:hypothetical protein
MPVLVGRCPSSQRRAGHRVNADAGERLLSFDVAMFVSHLVTSSRRMVP